MTVDEFAKQIANELRAAHNSKNQSSASAAIKKADETLARSNLTAADRAKFWSSVRAEFKSGQLLVERQENSALHALMQSILATLDAREAGK